MSAFRCMTKETDVARKSIRKEKELRRRFMDYDEKYFKISANKKALRMWVIIGLALTGSVYSRMCQRRKNSTIYSSVLFYLLGAICIYLYFYKD